MPRRCSNVACRSLTLTRFVDGPLADLVGAAVMRAAALTPPPASQVGEGVRVVVAAGAARLHDRQPAELAAPDDQRRFEQAALPPGRSSSPAIGVIGLAGEAAVVGGDVRVAVPAPFVLLAAASRSARSGRPARPAGGPSGIAWRSGEQRGLSRPYSCCTRSRLAVRRRAPRGRPFACDRPVRSSRCGRPAPPRPGCCSQPAAIEPGQQIELGPLLAVAAFVGARTRLSIGAPCGLRAVP